MKTKGRRKKKTATVGKLPVIKYQIKLVKKNFEKDEKDSVWGTFLFLSLLLSLLVCQIWGDLNNIDAE